MHLHFRRQLSRAMLTVAVIIIAPSLARAQIAGESVNMVTGTEWPGGDPYLQRQNEPSIAVSSANPEHLLAGANDYRTVDIAKAPADKMAGDAWAGIFKSLDGGKTWKSYLMPGYPQDPARYDAAGNKLPITSLKAPPLMWCGAPTAAVTDPLTGALTAPATDGTCTSAADPVVRAGADGMMYFGGIAFQRFTNYGKVYLTRFIDLNNKENGNAVQGSDPIRVVDQKVVSVGGPSDFVDKPWVAVDVPRSWNSTCNITVTNPDGTQAKRSFPGHTVYVAWLRLYNNETQSDVMVRHSDDCGATWSAPVKVNDATSLANEGPSIAIDPAKGHVYVTWRRVASAGQTNAIQLARSFSHGARFTKPRDVATVTPFDQQTTGTGFRVTLFPSSAISVDSTGARRLHVAWAERTDPATLDARVVVATKLLSPPPPTEKESDENDLTCQKLGRPTAVDGKPITVDATPIPGRGSETFIRGHQFMPSITFSQGRLMMVYYDTRLDHTRAYYRPYDPFLPDGTGSFYDLVRGPLGAPTADANNVPASADTQLDAWSDVFNLFVDDGNLRQVRHTVDVRLASALPSDAPAFSALPLSKFPFGTRGDEALWLDGSGNLNVPGFGPDLQIVQGGKVELLQQLKVNPPNLPMFKGGSRPFLGDYIDVQGPAFVRKNGKWAFNTDATPSPVFHAVWTSNEDVRAPPDGRWDIYAPINVQGTSRVDPTQQVVACTPQTAAYAASRNQNIYTSRITDGLVVSTPQNTKPLSSTYVRSFVIAATNATDRKKTVAFTFTVPSGTTASFKAASDTRLATLATVTADIAPHSTVSRTLFAKSGTATATITATVTEVVAAGSPAGASGFVLLNPPGTTPGLVAPDGSGAISGAETYAAIQVAANLSNANLSNANLSNANLSNANLSNANLSNANLSNANLSNANLSNAALANLSNANLSNANLSNANLSNANLSNANLSNANLSNANLSNANLSNAAISDLNYEYQNTGNTSTSYSIRVVGTKPNPGEVIQLIVAKTYTTPTAVGCDLKEEAHNHILTSIPDVSSVIVPATDKVDPALNQGSQEYATLVLAPGEKAQITLRGNVTLPRMAAIGSTLTPAPVPQQTPPGGSSGSATYAQFTPKASTSTSLGYDATLGTFTATVTSGPTGSSGPLPVTTGSVSFVTADNVFLATVPLDFDGLATFAPSTLSTGGAITAYYSGANAYLPSQGSATSSATTVTVNPTTATLVPSGTTSFIATVANAPNTTVTWTVTEPGGGTFTLDGSNYAAYTAPSTPGTYHLVARSAFDPSRTATATITVSVPPPVPTVATRTRLNILSYVPPATAGGPTTMNFQASVLPASSPTTMGGNVIFTVGGVDQAPVAVAGASAAFSVASTSLPVISARYAGDGTYQPSASLPFATRTTYVPDSVDTACSDGAAAIACPVTATDPAYGQDGSWTVNVPTFAMSTSGLSAIDSVTGLTWTPVDTSNAPRTYAQAAAYCASFAQQNYDGLTDWRLPSAREALSIANTGRVLSAVGPSSFFVAIQNGGIWTSDAYQPNSALNWVLVLNYPILMPSSASGSTWPGTTCVSSGATAALPTTGGSFLVNVPSRPGTVSDIGTGLVWQTSSAVGNAGQTTFTWLEALAYCNSLNNAPSLGGIASWRLPSLKELGSIVDITTSNPAIDRSVFPDTVSTWYWSSSPFFNFRNMAYTVSFANGSASINSPEVLMTTSHPVRCVAAGIPTNLNYAVGG